MKIPKVENEYGKYVANEEDQNYKESEEPDSSSLQEENEDVPIVKSSKSETIKNDETHIVYVSDDYKGNEFKNLIKQTKSSLNYTKNELLEKLLNYIQSNSINV
jgi:uncharacterized NAD-dependent epimerase/dehydratase family protein